jgi:hypothetical protein
MPFPAEYPFRTFKAGQALSVLASQAREYPHQPNITSGRSRLAGTLGACRLPKFFLETKK